MRCQRCPLREATRSQRPGLLGSLAGHGKHGAYLCLVGEENDEPHMMEGAVIVMTGHASRWEVGLATMVKTDSEGDLGSNLEFTPHFGVALGK